MPTEKWLQENREYLLSYHREYNKTHRGRQKKYKTKLLAWLTEYKVSQGCKYCEEDHPACLDFHHRDSSSKLNKGSFAKSIRGGWGLKKVQDEIAKCDVVCSNCHRKHHWTEGSVQQNTTEPNPFLQKVT